MSAVVNAAVNGSVRSGNLDKSKVKQAAHGQGPAILHALGLNVGLLDTSRYHLCPMCGKETFKFKEENEGGAVCQNNGCKPTGLGDWFAFVQWIRDCTFPDAVRFIADAIGDTSSRPGNGKPVPRPANVTPRPAAVGEAQAAPKVTPQPAGERFEKTFTPQDNGDTLFPYFDKKPITVDGLMRAGAQIGHAQAHPKAPKMHVLAVPVYDPATLEPVDWVMYHRGGSQELPVGGGKTAKTRMLHGKSGILLSKYGHSLLQAGREVPGLRVLKVEGASDFLAMQSVVDEKAENVLVFSNTDGALGMATAMPTARKLLLARPESIHCVGDCDTAGQVGLLGGDTPKGHIKTGWASILGGATAGKCLVHQLPYPIEPSKGKDIRDWLNEGNPGMDVFSLPAEQVAPSSWDEEPISEEHHIATLMAEHRVPPTVTTRELFDDSTEDVFLIENTLVESQPATVAGASKTMKTSMSIDMAISLATGTDFLGRAVPKPVPVLFLTSEIGKNQVRKLAYRIAKSKGVQLQLYESDLLHWNTWVPRINVEGHLEILAAEIKRTGAKVVFCDPLYLMLDGETAANYSLNAKQLQALCSVCLSAGATPICNDHAKRSSNNVKEYEPLELDDISGAGKAEYFRQWMLVSRRERFDEEQPHKLWLSIGGSAFAGSTLAVDIDERPDESGARTFTMTAVPAGEVRKAKAQARGKDRVRAKDEADEALNARLRRKADQLIEQVYRREAGLSLSQNDIAARLSVSGQEGARVLGMLLNDGKLRLVPKSLQKNNTKYDGYMLSDSLALVDEKLQN